MLTQPPAVVSSPNADSPLADGRPVAVVETDTLCEGCGYNLFAQTIFRDGRLGLLVYRCPECGRYAVPGGETDAEREHRRRVSGTIRIGQALFVFVLLVAWALVLALLQHDVLWSEGEARFFWAVGGWNRTLRSYYYHSDGEIMAYLLSALAGVGIGVLATWVGSHWPRKRARAVVLLPLVVALAYYNSWFHGTVRWMDRLLDGPADWTKLQTWGFSVVAFQTAVQTLRVSLGLIVGRPAARSHLRILLPPRPRLHFARLWFDDGLTPQIPSGKGAAAFLPVESPSSVLTAGKPAR